MEAATASAAVPASNYSRMMGIERRLRLKGFQMQGLNATTSSYKQSNSIRSCSDYDLRAQAQQYYSSKSSSSISRSIHPSNDNSQFKSHANNPTNNNTQFKSHANNLTLDDAFLQVLTTSSIGSQYNVLDHPYLLFIDDEHGSTSLTQSYLKHVHFVNRGTENRGEFIPFIVDNIEIGYIHPSFLEHLVCFPKVFSIMMNASSHHGISSNAKLNGQKSKSVPQIDGICSRKALYVTLHSDLKSREDRTKVVNQFLHVLADNGIIEGWRNEFYPVVDTFNNQPLFSLERAAVPYFGLKAYAIHINGFVEKNGEKYLWVARRSMQKQTFPGMFDHIVAGGQPEGITCKDNVIKECDEEASIPRIISESAKAVGAVSYECIDGMRFDRFTLFCYDLKLPSNFMPKNRDGEVESFSLVPVSKVAKILQRTIGLYKPDCALVIIDFLIRHGYISSDETGYLELLQNLRKGKL